MTPRERAATRLPSDEQREHLMVQAAKLFYELDRSQIEIAQELGLTRWQVSRLIEEARASGVVRIDIRPRFKRLTHLEAALQQHFGLREAIVTACGPDDSITLDGVAKATGLYLAGIGPQMSLLGVSWGRTMSAVAHWMPTNWSQNVHVVLINGATTIKSSPAGSNRVAEDFAERGAGKATLLPVPAIVGRAETRRVLETDPVIAQVLELAAAAPVGCFSLGPLATDSVLVGSGYLTHADIKALGDKGAVGDVLGRFVDADGQIADPDLDARTIGLPLEALITKERSVAVACGTAKHRITLACLRAGYINVLITDEMTARFALEGIKESP